MIIHNATQETIVVRSFAAGYIADFDKVAIIPSGKIQSVHVEGVSGEAGLDENFVVRDWARPPIEVDDTITMFRLYPSSVLIHKIPYDLDKKTYKGFLLTFFRLRERIRFWPTENLLA